MSAKELIKAFYDSDIAKDSKVVAKFFHEDCELHWTNSQGFVLLNYEGLKDFFKDMRQSYDSLRFEFTHFIEARNFVTTRCTLFAHTIENPDYETTLAHFSTIWEVKDGKIYRGFEISQQANEKDFASMSSYKEIKL